MVEYIREAGWGVWPVFLFSAFALVLAVRYAMRPRPETLPLIVGFSVATALAGGLGAITGLQASAGGMPQVAADSRWIFLIGLKESLNNLVVAFVALVLVSLITTIGSYRRARDVVARDAGTRAAHA